MPLDPGLRGLFNALRRPHVTSVLIVVLWTLQNLGGAPMPRNVESCDGSEELVRQHCVSVRSEELVRSDSTETTRTRTIGSTPSPTVSNGHKSIDLASFADGILTEAAFDYYSPIMRSLARNGPPSASCLPTLPGKATKTPKWDTVLVLAQGRSGSTSMLRLLNKFPCYNIRGENSLLMANAILPERFSVEALKIAEDQIASQRMSNWNWTNYVDPGLPIKPSHFNRWNRTQLRSIFDMMGRTDKPDSTTDANLKKLLVNNFLEHLPGHLTGGFKEIRLFSPLDLNFESSLLFVDEWIRMYPRTAFVIVTRETSGLRRSGWWRTMNVSMVEEVLRQQSEWLDKFASIVDSGMRYGPVGSAVKGLDVSVAAVRVKYEDFTVCSLSSDSTLLQLYQTLEEAPSQDACRLIMGRQAKEKPFVMSDFDFANTQGTLDWEYGFRKIDHPGGSLGDFQILEPIAAPIPNTEEHEYRHPQSSNLSCFLRRTLHTPFVAESGTQFVPCRKWSYSGPGTATVTLQLTIGKPSAGCEYVVSLSDGSNLFWHHNAVGKGTIALSSNRTLGPGSAIELCVARGKETATCGKLHGLDVVLSVTRLGITDPR